MTKQQIISARRAVIELMRVKYAQFRVMETALREHQVIANGQTTYSFAFRSTKDQLAEMPQVLLKDTDFFVILGIKMYLAKISAAKPGVFIPFTYPNSVEFGTNYNDLEVFYTSLLSIQFNTQIVSDAIDTGQFRFVPEQIQQASVPSVSPARVHDSYSYHNGSLVLEQPVVMSGKMSNTFEHKLSQRNTNLQVAGAGSGTEHYLGYQLTGLKVSGASETHYAELIESLRSLY